MIHTQAPRHPFVVFMLLLAACTSTSPPPSLEGAAITRILRREVATGNFSGVALAARGDRILHRRGYGFADVASGTVSTPDTALPIASLTKLFTQVAVLRLAEQGRLQLDDSVAEHRPDFQADIANRITLHQLLAMTSGLPRELHPDPSRSGVRFGEEGLAGPYLDDISDLELLHEPGTEAVYSNLGYWLLGAVIESVTGSTYAQAMDELVWSPLGLTGTGSGPPPHGRGHLSDGNGRRIPVSDPEVENRYASGALYSTVDDLHLLCNALRHDDLISHEAALSMASGFRNAGRQRTNPMVIFNGHQPGVVTFFACGLDDPITIILLANTALEPPERIGKLAAEVFEAMR